MWYRNGGRGAYHLAREDWIRSGKAVCGAAIPNPGYTAKDVAAAHATGRDVCRRCTASTYKGDKPWHGIERPW